MRRVGIDPALSAPLVEPGTAVGELTPSVLADTGLRGPVRWSPSVRTTPRRRWWGPGVDGTVRFLRNVMGLWLLQECLRDWGSPDLAPLLAAAESPPLAAVVDAADPAFIPPGDMPARVAAACVRTGQTAPDGPAATVRCVLDSLALAPPCPACRRRSHRP